MKQFAQQILPGPHAQRRPSGATAPSKSASPGGLAPPQRAVAHDRGAGEPAGPGEVDQRPQGCERELPAAPASGRPDAALGEPARRRGGPRHAARLRGDAWPVRRARSDRHARSRRGGRGRRQRWLRRSVVPARGRRTFPPGYATKAPGSRFFARQGSRLLRRRWGPGSAVFQYPNDNRASTIWYHDHALGMTRLNVYAGPAGFYIVRGGPAGDDAVLDTRSGSTAVLPGPAPTGERHVPARQDVLRDPDRDPGSLVQRRRVALLSGLARVLRRSDGRGPGFIPDDRPLADLEPRVLREHDHGQREHVALPRRSSSAATASAS